MFQCEQDMSDRDYTLIQILPRHQLEEVAVRALSEAGLARRSLARNALFNSAMIGFAGGALLSAAGFIVGALLR